MGEREVVVLGGEEGTRMCVFVNLGLVVGAASLQSVKCRDR